MNIMKGTMIGQFFDTWLKSQILMSEVERWSRFRRLNPSLRRQSSLHHEYSICLILIPVLFKFKSINHLLDTEFLKDAFMVHDMSEGLLKMQADISFVEKVKYDDLEEYRVFIKHLKSINGLEKSIFDYFEKCFLLQFAHKGKEDLDIFPKKTLSVLNKLKKKFPNEVQLFPALEQWEYIFYAYEGFIKHNDLVIFINVLRNQVPDLVRYSQEIEGFQEILFPKFFEDELLHFMEINKNVEQI